jgi:uncharacterized protein
MAGGRRPPQRGSGDWLRGLGVGVVLGIGAVIAVLALGQGRHHAVHRPPHPAAVHHVPTAVVHPAPARRPQQSRQAPAPHQGQRTSPPRPPRENPEASESPPVLPAETGPNSGSKAQGHLRVAIIFDDAGYGLHAAREIMAFGRPVTMSVLPDLPYSTQIAEEAPPHGVQIILHLPVQPENPAILLGPGGVTVDMDDRAIQQTVAADLATVPTAVGANNHMGSLGTTDPRVMRAVITVIRTRHLFFVDSMTSPRSVAGEVARSMGVPTASRAVFLDNQDDAAYVRAQFLVLIKIVQSRGQAIAIGHVGKVTIRVLQEMLPAFDEAGIQLVPVSRLVQ